MPASSPTPMFVALEPDAATSRWILADKVRAHALVGPQLYLDHPPHLTLYVGVFPDVDAVIAATRRLAEGWSAPLLSLAGWHPFLNDPLTGNHTLTASFPASDCDHLRRLQLQVIETLAPLRDIAATQQRIGGRLAQLSPSEQAAAERYGFPYVGAGWHPHFTIASFRPDAWPAIEEALLPAPPSGTAACPQLRVYRLVEEHPELLAEIDLIPAATALPGGLRPRILTAIRMVADQTPGILSATVTGSFLTKETLDAVSDIDLVIVVEELHKALFDDLQQKFTAALEPVVAADGLRLRLNTTLGPRKFNEPDLAVLHLMIYSRESHRLHAIRSPFTCLDWQRSTEFCKLSLADAYPVFALQPRHFLSARRGPRDYLRDFDRSVVSYREIECDESTCREIPREQPMSVRDRYEYAYHVQRFLMQNLLKLVRRRNEAPDSEALLEAYFTVFPRSAASHRELYTELAARKSARDFSRPIPDIDLRLRTFVADFEDQFRHIFQETATRHLVFRHGPTALNGGTADARRFVGRVDPPLETVQPTDLSCLRAILGERKLTAVYSSPLQRCQQSLAALSTQQSLPPTTTDDRLLEIDYGQCDGLTIAEARSRFPDLFSAWGRGEDPAFPAGESTDDVVRRIEEFANEVWDQARGDTLTCSHNVVVRAIIGQAMGIPRPHWHRIVVPHLTPITLIQTRDYGRFLDLDESVESELFANFLAPPAPT